MDGPAFHRCMQVWILLIKRWTSDDATVRIGSTRVAVYKTTMNMLADCRQSHSNSPTADSYFLTKYIHFSIDICQTWHLAKNVLSSHGVAWFSSIGCPHCNSCNQEELKTKNILLRFRSCIMLARDLCTRLRPTFCHNKKLDF